MIFHQFLSISVIKIFIPVIKVSKQPTNKKCDPVSLYHYYMSLWAKYKPNVPGENNWSDLRWQIRQKMAGSFPKQGPKVIIIATIFSYN